MRHTITFEDQPDGSVNVIPDPPLPRGLLDGTVIPTPAQLYTMTALEACYEAGMRAAAEGAPAPVLLGMH